MEVRKRNGKIVEYDGKKIISAIRKAFKAAGVEDTHNIAFNTAFMVTVILENRGTDEPITIVRLWHGVYVSVSKWSI